MKASITHLRRSVQTYFRMALLNRQLSLIAAIHRAALIAAAFVALGVGFELACLAVFLLIEPILGGPLAAACIAGVHFAVAGLLARLASVLRRSRETDALHSAEAAALDSVKTDTRAIGCAALAMEERLEAIGRGVSVGLTALNASRRKSIGDCDKRSTSDMDQLQRDATGDYQRTGGTP